jgi:hypothetical protein
VTIRDDDARRAARTLGAQLNMYFTGDPGPDDVAEYLAAGWLITDDYYSEEDDPPRDVGTELILALRQQAAALNRIAGDLERGDITLDSLRRIELPR